MTRIESVRAVTVAIRSSGQIMATIRQLCLFKKARAGKNTGNDRGRDNNATNSETSQHENAPKLMQVETVGAG